MGGLCWSLCVTCPLTLSVAQVLMASRPAEVFLVASTELPAALTLKPETSEVLQPVCLLSLPAPGVSSYHCVSSSPRRSCWYHLSAGSRSLCRSPWVSTCHSVRRLRACPAAALPRCLWYSTSVPGLPPQNVAPSSAPSLSCLSPGAHSVPTLPSRSFIVHIQHL